VGEVYILLEPFAAGGSASDRSNDHVTATMDQMNNILGLKSEARLRYGDADFQVLSPGDFVRCAVTGKPIALQDLKYWNVKRQEAYVDAAASLKRHLECLEKAAHDAG
jgi:hypothetical protein